MLYLSLSLWIGSESRRRLLVGQLLCESWHLLGKAKGLILCNEGRLLLTNGAEMLLVVEAILMLLDVAENVVLLHMIQLSSLDWSLRERKEMICDKFMSVKKCSLIT